MILEAALALSMLRSPKPPCVDMTAIRRIVSCAARRYGKVDPEVALAVASCESSLDPEADSGTHVGLYQHAHELWAARWAKYGKPLGLSRDPRDPVSNAIVSMRMVADRDIRWTPWSCAA